VRSSRLGPFSLFAVALMSAACAPGGESEVDEQFDNQEGALVTTVVTVDGAMSLEDEYVPRVCTQENGGADFEALKAQAVAARTYVLRAMRDDKALGTNAKPIQNSQGFQAYASFASEACIQATQATRGVVGRYQGQIVIANFVAGALWNENGSLGSDPTGTEKWVTYNEGLSGTDVHPTPLSYMARSDNRGCMSQNGSDWLALHGYDYVSILRYFYGADLELEGAPVSNPPPPPAPSGATCKGLNNGLYCGDDYVNGDANTLYRCTNGSVSVEEVCANGCVTMSAGTNDVCAAAPPPPPTPSCAGLANGHYCGNDYVNGDPNTLYLCMNGAASVAEVCSNGCKIMPPGYADMCN